MSEARQNSLRSMVEKEGAIYDYLPEAHCRVLVHCEDYTCMAYLDDKGIWRNRFDDLPIVGRVIAWESL